MATSFSGGRSWSIRREPLTMGKQLILYHLRLRTHAILVIGLYELLGNPTTKLIEPPGPFNTQIKCDRNRITTLYNTIYLQVYHQILLELQCK